MKTITLVGSTILAAACVAALFATINCDPEANDTSSSSSVVVANVNKTSIGGANSPTSLGQHVARVRRFAEAPPWRKGPKLSARPPSTSTTTTTTTTTSATEDSSCDTAECEEDNSEQETTTKKAAPSKSVLGGKTSQKATPKPSSSGSKKKTDLEMQDDDDSIIIEKNYTSVSYKNAKKPIFLVPLIKEKNESVCIAEAYLEFPSDLFGNKWRSRGFVVVHLAVVCYMFYSLALICEKYFMPALEEFALRLGLSEDVAGATLMSAGSSAPELFTAILGVFIAKGDVGTGTIVGSAVFNILFVIGVCAFVSSTSAQLNWWPVMRDSLYYTLTVLVLIMFIYDERITTFESLVMILLYGGYILIMSHNNQLKELVTKILLSNPNTARLFGPAIAAGAGGANCSDDGPNDVFGSVSSNQQVFLKQINGQQVTSKKLTNIENDSLYLAACLVIIKHKRLFRSQLRFQATARYIIVKRQHLNQKAKSKHTDEVNYFGPEDGDCPQAGSGGQKRRIEAYAKSSSLSKSKFSIVSRDDYEFWNRPPEANENYYLWCAKIPVNYVLHYTVPDAALYPDKYLITFCLSIMWTAFFSYIMVWMVTLIGYTFGIPDSVMGFTFLAAGTSVPDCYSSIHAARNGMADMAVSNSIGSNVFDILIGLAVPWFIQTLIHPGVAAKINSRGVIYSVMLLFLSLIVTIYLMNKYEWTLKPKLGLALLIAYALFIVLTCMLEFNLFGHVNPPPCPVLGG